MNIAAGGLTQLAYCWLVERRDGAGLALTSHDQSLMVDGVRYAPAPGIEPKSLRFSEGLDPDDSEVAGSLTSDAITSRDLQDGLWDGARTQLFAVDWNDLERERITLFDGELGDIRTEDDRFSADVIGSAASLARAACPSTSPLCRARLGDRDCRVDMAGRSRRVSVIMQAGSSCEVDTDVSADFLFGSLRVLTGGSRGFRTTILEVAATALTLRDVPAQVIEQGSLIELVEGCDQRFATCSDRFGNSRNFRGEPHLPGTDLLTRFPGA